MIRVGLTGGVASGKSTVATLLVEQGAVLIDADTLSREVVAAGTPGFSAVREAFGEDVVGLDGELDRPALGRLVFADPEARRRLEAIVHPLVFERMQELEQAASSDAVVVHDIPLLAERGPGGTDEFDAVVVVDAPEDLQVQRMTTDRGWTPEDARSRIAAQASREDRLAVATHVVVNTGTREELRRRVHEVLAEITVAHGS
ncbi:MAG: dephospho-CoA kinase [Marmoricola sp.]|nr:dephospho-CoA kinase [Marmoricola sp.]